MPEEIAGNTEDYHASVMAKKRCGEMILAICNN